MSQKRKIIFVIVSLYGGGAEKSLINLLHEFDYEKYEVDLILFKKEGLFLNQVPEQVNLLEIPHDLDLMYRNSYKGSIRRISDLKYVLTRFLGTGLVKVLPHKSVRARRQVRWKKFYRNAIRPFDREYDIAVAYLECEPTYYVLDKIRAGRKYVWVHNDYDSTGLDSSYDYPYFRQADAVVTISDKCANILRERFPEAAEKVWCIPNITTSKYIRELAADEPDEPFREDRFKILSIGRLSEQKGFDMAVKAAHLLKQRGYRFEWIIIGEGELKNELTERINRYGLNDFVRLVGQKSNPYPYMRCCDFLAQTSRYEGKSVVLDEAKILSKPILATRYPTVHDQLDEKIGLIVEMNPEAIADGMERLFLHPELLEGMQRELEQHDFGNTHEISCYYELFESDVSGENE